MYRSIINSCDSIQLERFFDVLRYLIEDPEKEIKNITPPVTEFEEEAETSFDVPPEDF